MFKKLGIMLLVLTVTAAAAACGGTDDKSEDSTPSADIEESSTATGTGGSSSGTTSSSFDENTEDETIETESATLDVKASLPDNYPQDVFPIYPGSQISHVMDMGSGFTVIAHSSTVHSDVIAFYKDVLKDAVVTSETEEDTSLTSFGSKSGYTYNMDVALSNEYEGFKTQIMITFYK